MRDDENARRALGDAIRVLNPFVASWQPSGTAHNDFYDDQMLALPDGRIALVDFEEPGPGDPLLDVGNFLAHLRWASCFGRKRGALEGFCWSERDLALRKAVCLFRICTNPSATPGRTGRASCMPASRW